MLCRQRYDIAISWYSPVHYRDMIISYDSIPILNRIRKFFKNEPKLNWNFSIPHIPSGMLTSIAHGDIHLPRPSTVTGPGTLVLFLPPLPSTVCLALDSNTSLDDCAVTVSQVILSGLTAITHWGALMSACSINGRQCAQVWEPNRNLHYSKIHALMRCILIRLQCTG